MAVLSVRDLEVTFAAEEGKVEAVRGISFDVEADRTTAIVGESGSGKTVVSQAILGILPANASIDRGSILFDDPKASGGAIDLASIAQDDPRRRSIRGARISIIFQEPMSSLSPLHRIGDQIAEVLVTHEGLSSKAAKARTVEMLGLVGFTEPQRAVDRFTFELSGGLRQRAMIAMALICKPLLLIADEPTTALDVTIQAQILKLMQDLQAEFGMATLFITHDLGVVANVAESMVVMYRGRIVERGPCRALLGDPQHPYLKALLGAVPRLTTSPDQRLATLRPIPIHLASLGHDETDKRPVSHAITGPLLKVDSLRKTFLTRRAGLFGRAAHELLAVDDVSFSIDAGQCFAIVGESGSGKTTVAKMIMRAIASDGGSVIYHDEDIEVDVLRMESGLTALRRKIQYIFQDPFGSLNPRMTVFDIIAEPLVVHEIGDAADQRRRVSALMEAVGLDPRWQRRFPHSFSGGQRQRIGIARALALRPRLLICDEPVSALDVSVQAQILNLLKDLQRELGLTYLFISHNLAVVRYLAQRVGVMCAGRMVEWASTEALFSNPTHPYTKALLAAVPEPDLGRPLDLTALMNGRASSPDTWPAPYTLGTEPGLLHKIAHDHFVRMTA